ncbi:MAG: hypothetical protein V1854_06540 [Methanobacteriota archaeon]
MEVLPDSSTIIALAKIDSLDLLKETFNAICITKDVEGEKSILNYAKGRKNVLVILDEAEARALAEEEGIPYTGTIGLIVFAFENGKISMERAVEIVKRLAKSDFRMTVELYDWALEKLK